MPEGAFGRNVRWLTPMAGHWCREAAMPAGLRRQVFRWRRPPEADGVVGGFPDLMFFGIKGGMCCVELKAEAAGCRDRRPQ
jgi:hypothetical protein